MAGAAGNPFGPPDPAAVSGADSVPSTTADPPVAQSEPATAASAAQPEEAAGNPFGAPVATSDGPGPAKQPTEEVAPEKEQMTVMVGTLKKKGAIPGLLGYTWKSRHVRVADGKLTYHESKAEADAGENPIKDNVLKLDEYVITVEEKDPNHFQLRPLSAAERVWEFDCEDSKYRNKWMAALQSNGADKASWAD